MKVYPTLKEQLREIEKLIVGYRWARGSDLPAAKTLATLKAVAADIREQIDAECQMPSFEDLPF
jgi:hypothetical protein